MKQCRVLESVCNVEPGLLLGPDRQRRERIKRSRRYNCVAINWSDNIMIPMYSIIWRRAYLDLARFDEAWGYISEAVAAMETTKERWWEAEVYRFAGEIALKSPERDNSKAQA